MWVENPPTILDFGKLGIYLYNSYSSGKKNPAEYMTFQVKKSFILGFNRFDGPIW